MLHFHNYEYVRKSDWEYKSFRGYRLGIFQPTITCSKLIIETLEQGVKYVQS